MLHVRRFKSSLNLYKLMIVISILFSPLSFSDTKLVSAKDLLINQMSAKPHTIIDVRTPEEFASGHLKGALNIPYDQIAAQSFLLAKLKSETLVVYCRSGRRANIFERALLEQGFKLLHLEGDMLGWQSQGLPVVK
ncbi:rhodanese-like domain-containing protein [Pseudoalteromonas sp. Of7M-16]|uniref:rhodanese-like domain-containing protein n=1 Tax=Pseudoalteromonas sp. Of7M-16 TaxID=2917756 RepID=UPI001EF6544B|nr:rhodanese-like domain-containing protein [Pseudoalteromonas sp. Of7M-16]MCG7548944.1 rhodanese-like domain-containing protein [Pseudoalteromonas sp. Of7M-16]